MNSAGTARPVSRFLTKESRRKVPLRRLSVSWLPSGLVPFEQNVLTANA